MDSLDRTTVELGTKVTSALTALNYFSYFMINVYYVINEEHLFCCLISLYLNLGILTLDNMQPSPISRKHNRHDIMTEIKMHSKRRSFDKSNTYVNIKKENDIFDICLRKIRIILNKLCRFIKIRILEDPPTGSEGGYRSGFSKVNIPHCIGFFQNKTRYL